MSNEFPDPEKIEAERLEGIRDVVTKQIGFIRITLIEEETEAIENLLRERTGNLSAEERETLSKALYSQLSAQREIFLSDIAEDFLIKMETFTEEQIVDLIQAKKNEYVHKQVQQIIRIYSEFHRPEFPTEEDEEI